MIFHSLTYIEFLLCTLAGYWLLPERWRNLFLVPASLIFYGWAQPWFLLPFVATTVIDYTVARGLAATPGRRRWLVTVSVISNLGLLGIFKYFNFFADNLRALFEALHWHVPLPVLHVVLPAGISFYTFQSLGYVIDVSRGHVPACRSLRDYALFVSFFPQLVAGPIQRAGHLLTQVQHSRTVTPANLENAVVLLAWGFFKKLVIADRVAVTADKIFALQSPSFPILWTGVLAFCIQIYADFSAYTDIARGTARLFGFDLTPNFNHPYLADSPSDFWRRWHISLSTWIRDYLFIPLGGSRGSEARTLRNLVIVFFLTGLWHGASWNFVLWGLYYAVLTIIYRLAGHISPPRLTNLPGMRPLRIVLMFVLTNIGWLIFRERRVGQLWHDLALRPAVAPAADWVVASYLGAIILIFSAPLVLHAIWDVLLRERFARRLPSPQWGWCGATGVCTILFTILLILYSETVQDFIYFQF